MRLSDTSNAHGAIWSENYGLKVCYTDLFATSFDGSNPHSCTTNHYVLKLSDTKNAHAAERSFSTYSIDICYQGLSECNIKAEGESCDANDGEATLAFISGRNNAHLSWYPPDSNTGYLSVCCKGEEDSVVIPRSSGTAACYELDEEQCGSENGAIAELDPGCIGERCKCDWDETQNRCNLEWYGSTSTGGGTTGCYYKCVIEGSEETECSGGSQVVRLNARQVLDNTTTCDAESLSIEDTNCRSSSKIMPCGSLEENLPFFGIWQIFAGVAIAIVIYALVHGRRAHS